MEDTARSGDIRITTSRPSAGRRRRVRHISHWSLGLLCLLAIACSQSGCSLFVMGGKMLFGDPKITSLFEKRTRVNLVKDRKKIVVVCSTPEAIKTDLPSLNVDLLEGITRRLKRHGITVVKPDDVATWMDDNGGDWGSPAELAQQFDADYILYVDLHQFDFQMENSPNLYQGRAMGNVFGYRVQTVGQRKEAIEVFTQEFTSVYPPMHPIEADRIMAKTFRKQFLDRVSGQLAQLFYDHRASERIH